MYYQDVWPDFQHFDISEEKEHKTFMQVALVTGKDMPWGQTYLSWCMTLFFSNFGTSKEENKNHEITWYYQRDAL